jgi:hypothetical protein
METLKYIGQKTKTGLIDAKNFVYLYFYKKKFGTPEEKQIATLRITKLALAYGTDITKKVGRLYNNLPNILDKLPYYIAGDRVTLMPNEDTSILADVTVEEMSSLPTATLIDKINILYKILIKVIPADKKIKIDVTQKKNISDRLSKYTIPTENNLLGYLLKNRNKPLDNFTRLILPIKFSNLSWYVNYQIINNPDYILILDILALFDVFIDVEGHENFFKTYIQKVKITGLTTVDIEFILTLLWIIMDMDINVKDEYKYNPDKPENSKYELEKINNIFNVIFNLDKASLLSITPFNMKLLKKLGPVVLEDFTLDIKKSLLKNISEPYLSTCNAQIHTLTLGQFIANFLLSIKDKSPILSMLYLGSFQRLIDNVISPKKEKESTQTGGAIASAVLIPIIAANISKILQSIVDNSINVISTLDMYSKHYLPFFYTPNITYNELWEKLKASNYNDSFIYILESEENKYPYLRSLLLTTEFMPDLTPEQRKIFMQSPKETKKEIQDYKSPTPNMDPFGSSFTNVKNELFDKSIETYDFLFILNLLCSISPSTYGTLATAYNTLNNELRSTETISVHKYIRVFNRKQNILDTPSRIILDIFDIIQKNKNTAKFLRQLILYQVIYTNTYLLVAEYLSISDSIINIKTGRRALTESDYKDIRNIAEKVASLLYKKNKYSANYIANAYLFTNNLLLLGNIPASKLFKKVIDFIIERKAYLEISKIDIAYRLSLLKDITTVEKEQLKKEASNVRNASELSELSEEPSSKTNSSSNNESFKSAKSTHISSSNKNSHSSAATFDTPEMQAKKEQNLITRCTLLNFYKFIFQYNLAITSYDIEASLGYNIIDGLFICDETKDILDFYKMDTTKYDLYMSVDITERINFLEY